MASDWIASAGDGVDTASVAIGSLTGSCSGGNVVACSGLLINPNGAPMLLPFTLGTYFQFTIASDFRVTTSVINQGTTAGGDISLSFQLLTRALP